MEITTVLIIILCLYMMSSIISWLVMYSSGYIDMASLKEDLGIDSSGSGSD